MIEKNKNRNIEINTNSYYDLGLAAGKYRITLEGKLSLSKHDTETGEYLWPATSKTIIFSIIFENGNCYSENIKSVYNTDLKWDSPGVEARLSNLIITKVEKIS